MSVTREQLYEAVWAQPMTVVATRFEVSANYLARVCHHLNVPHPVRGYWAKLSFGKKAKRPALPDARPGEVLEWMKGDSVPRVVQPLRGKENPEGRGSKIKPRERAARHLLVAGVKEFFEAGRLSEVGYLRPRKRNLVDLFVSKETLGNALDLANELFQRCENQGHRVTLASEYLHRPKLTMYDGQTFDYHNDEPWAPGRPTLVFIGTLPFGLTVYETTEHVDATYDWDSAIRYVRATQAAAKRRPAWDSSPSTSKQHMPSGRLAVRAYSPHGRVNWEQRWAESTPGALIRKVTSIVKELEGAVPSLVQRREEAEKEMAVERTRWEEECRERERQEEVRRRAEAIKASRQQLLALVDDWSLARSIESFFEDAERRASSRPAAEHEALRERLRRARAMLGGIDALDRFHEWRSPEERD
jgi:hypothetical protein